MVSTTWRIEEPPPAAPAKAGPPLVTVRFLLDALRRRWRTWVGFGLVGLLMGAAYAFLLPTSSVGTATLLLAHEEGTDPAVAMSTDVSLMRTRTVAETVTDKLDLDLTPEEFQASVVALPVTSQILTLEVRATRAAEAKERAAELTETFLSFRNAQLRGRSDSVIAGYRSRVASLQERVDILTAEYDRLSAGGAATQSQATEVLTERSQLSSQIGSLQEQIENTALQADSLVAASHVVDPASVVPRSALKRPVLAIGSGLIGGLALGVAVVLFAALTSDRLRNRDEVALALGVPLRVSTPRLRAASRLPFLRRPSHEHLAPITHALTCALPEADDGPQRLMVVAVDSLEDGELVTASLAAELSGRGRTVLLVDLGEAGGLAGQLTGALDRAAPGVAAVPSVLRPDGVPHLASGPFGVPAGTSALVSEDDPRRLVWEQADVVLVLASVQPGSDVELLSTWADDAVLLVTAGRSSAERLSTSAELVRSAGLRVPFAVMVSADATDESLGVPDPAPADGASRDRSVAR